MIVAITGGRGFIGHRLVMRHLAEGDTVRVLSRRPSDESDNTGLLEWFSGDLCESGSLDAFVDGADVLYHCAGEINDESRMEAVHISGTSRLIAAATGKIGRWVQLSSTGAYGQPRVGMVTEETALKPHGQYEVTKVASDSLVCDAASGGAFQHVILRPTIVYGAAMPNRSLYALISMISRGLFFYIGKLGASANYVHVDNVVDALRLCGKLPQANGEVYNLSDYRTIEQFAVIIAESLGCPAPRLRLPEVPVRLLAALFGFAPRFPLTSSRIDAMTVRSLYSTEKIEHGLGYRHRLSMEEGLAELVGFWLKQHNNASHKIK